jgi:hypothetical protein
MTSNFRLFNSDPLDYRGHNQRLLSIPGAHSPILSPEKLMDHSRKLKMVHPTPEEMEWIEIHLKNDRFRDEYEMIRDGMRNKDDIRGAFYKTLLFRNAQDPPSELRDNMEKAIIRKMNYLPEAASAARRRRLRAIPKTLMSGKRSLKGRLEKYRGGGKKKRKTKRKTRKKTRKKTSKKTRRNKR